MKLSTASFLTFSECIPAVLCLMLIVTNVHPVTAQVDSGRERLIKKGNTELAIGGALIVAGGVIMAVSTNKADWDYRERALTNIGIGGLVVGGSIVAIVGVIHLINGNRLRPSVEKQSIPGLDHMGIVYPKYPTIGIKYRL